MNAENILYESNPAMFRNRPFLFVICVVLIAAYGLGLVILFLWWFSNKGTVLTVTEERTILRRGIFSKSTNEVWHRDIRNVQLNQSFLQRIFNVGSIGLSSSGQSGVEIAIDGLPSPNKVKRLIDERRRNAG